jgi:hypothetical protein
MSGYSDGQLSHGHFLDDGIAFIEKPFTAAQLLTRIGEMLAAVPGLADRDSQQSGRNAG